MQHAPFPNFSASPDPIKISEGADCCIAFNSAYYSPFLDHFAAFPSLDPLDNRLAALDNCAGCCITPYISNFIFGDYVPRNINAPTLTGVGGATKIHGKGTVLWTFNDDQDISHSFPLTAYLVPSCPLCFLRPQTIANDLFPDSADYGTSVQTFGSHSILQWDDCRFNLCVLHEPKRGIPLIPLHAPLRCTVDDTATVAACMSLTDTMPAYTSISTLQYSNNGLSSSSPHLTSPGDITTAVWLPPPPLLIRYPYRSESSTSETAFTHSGAASTSNITSRPCASPGTVTSDNGVIPLSSAIPDLSSYRQSCGSRYHNHAKRVSTWSRLTT